MGPKIFSVKLLKWSCLRLRRNIFFRSCCICVSERCHHRCLVRMFCWIWLETSHFLNIKTEDWDLKILLFNYWNDLALGSVETYFFEVTAYMCLKGATAGVWEGRFCWIWLDMSHFVKYKKGVVGPKVLLFNYWNDLI